MADEVSIVRDGDMLCATVPLPAVSADEAMSAWLDPVKVEQWWGGKLLVEPSIGGAYRLRFDNLDQTMNGEIRRITRFLLRFSWSWEHEPDAPDRVVTVRTVADADGSVMVVTHGPYTSKEQDEFEEHRTGWAMFLPQLVRVVSGLSVVARRLGSFLRLLVAGALGYGAWLLLYLGAHDASLVTWGCEYDGCANSDLPGTTDFAAVAGWAGAVVAGLAGGVAARVFRHATPGMVLALIGAGTATGLRDSIVDLGVPAETLHGWLLAADITTAVGAVAALVGAVRAIRRTGVLNRLRGRAAVPGRVHHWVPGTGRTGTGIVSFLDRSGQRHDVAGRFALRHPDRPVTVYHDPAAPGDADRLRLGIPRESDKARLRADLMAALQEAVPVAEDPAPVAADPVGSPEDRDRPSIESG